MLRLLWNICGIKKNFHFLQGGIKKYFHFLKGGITPIAAFAFAPLLGYLGDKVLECLSHIMIKVFFSLVSKPS